MPRLVGLDGPPGPPLERDQPPEELLRDVAEYFGVPGPARRVSARRPCGRAPRRATNGRRRGSRRVTATRAGPDESDEPPPAALAAAGSTGPRAHFQRGGGRP
jgi:hypothetical protein